MRLNDALFGLLDKTPRGESKLEGFPLAHDQQLWQQQKLQQQSQSQETRRGPHSLGHPEPPSTGQAAEMRVECFWPSAGKGFTHMDSLVCAWALDRARTQKAAAQGEPSDTWQRDGVCGLTPTVSAKSEHGCGSPYAPAAGGAPVTED